MNTYISLLFLLSFAALHASPMSSGEAIDFLKSNPAQTGRILEIIGKSQAAADLYQRQLDAIVIIQNDSNAECGGILIPYLNYVVSPAAMMAGRNIMTGKASLDDTIRIWPAFGSILRMKEAPTQLRQYILNKMNPLNYRLTAFLVLRYVDKTSFQNLEHALDSDFINSSPAAKEYLKHIEDGSYQFWGVPDLK